METAKQKLLFESGNELAAYAAKQINYHVMGYYPITPSTQIAEYLDRMGADGEHTIALVPAEGEHSAAGICYGASTGGGRVFNATSANGLLYALEQLPVQSGTRLPMVLNIACRTVSGPLSIKGDHSDIMYTLNTGWIILFAASPQEVYDCNICAIKIAEKLRLPVIVAFDGFFTSHQKRNCYVFSDDETVQKFVGPVNTDHTSLNPEHPITIGSYMNEPDLMNNKYQLHLAMEKARTVIPEIFDEYEQLSGRKLNTVKSYKTDDAEMLLFVLGSAYLTAKAAVDKLRGQGKNVGVFTLGVLRPFPSEQIVDLCKNARTILIADRQDSYGANGGNMSLEIRAALQQKGLIPRVISRIYGLGGRDFFEQDALELFELCYDENTDDFDYFGTYPGDTDFQPKPYFKPITDRESPVLISCTEENGKVSVKGGTVRDTTARPKRLAPGHGACPGCGIPVNVNLLLRGIEGNVVLLFQTGCGMVVTTSYPKTAFKVPYVHNLFQNGAATLAGISKMYHKMQERGELPEGDITFVMVSGDGGMDIGMGSALGTALRGDPVILFEYDNGGYMNTGYQLSYSTPIAEKTADYILREMTSSEGGFFSAQDADSEGEEGKYYLFTPDEIIKVLGKTDGEKFSMHFDITNTGNFEGKSIPNLLHSDPNDKTFEAFLPKLQQFRKKRYSLHLDDKILTSWNSLMISAMCRLYLVSKKDIYFSAAQKADKFIQKYLCEDNTLFVSFRDGKRGINGFLDDYARYIFAQLCLYRTTLDNSYLNRAKQMSDKVIEDFSDNTGGFYLYGNQSEELILRPKETYDGAIPSGNSLMAYNFVKLYLLTSDDKYKHLAGQQLDFISSEASQYPINYAMFLTTLLEYSDPPMKVTIVADGKTEIKSLPLILPAKAVINLLTESTEEYSLKNGKTTYYVCNGHRCMPPTNELNEIRV